MIKAFQLAALILIVIQLAHIESLLAYQFPDAQAKYTRDIESLGRTIHHD